MQASSHRALLEKCDVEALFGLPFLELVYQAAEVHRQNFNPREIQLSTLLSIKPAVVPKIAPTVRNQRTTTPIWAKSR
ncbi:putative biotin synthase [Neisseria gonorrhoeae]|uniref:Putative biotin synthase n=1 Tax=Neisseria gonorrhoeae TaxID=485 RepID=A0A378VW84_NEIGO|nr:putative biotin synthase [Neisseria gonorrhoeae]